MNPSRSITPIHVPKIGLSGTKSLCSRGAGLLLIIALAIFAFAEQSQAQVTYALSNLFTIATGTGNLLASATGNRGMAYDPVSNLVYTANSTATSISAFDGSTGALVGSFTMTGVGGGTTFGIDQIGVAADGAIYGINLNTSSASNGKLYRWSNWTATATVAFNANPLANGGSIPLTSGRIGDTLAVTGSGVNTLILAGVGTKPVFSLFWTTDGLNFTNTIINVPSGLSSIAGNVFGLTFYTNNTFLVKSASSSSSLAYLVSYPANYQSQTLVTGSVVGSTALGGSYANTTMLAYNPNAGFLGVVTTGGNPTPVGVLGASNILSGVTSLATTNAVTAYNGGNATGGVALGGTGQTNVIYAYNTGDALYAYKILTVPPVAPSISSAPAGGNFYTSATLSVTASGTTPFSYFWKASTSNSATGTYTNIPGANTNTLTITSGTNYYEVVITNIAGAITSTPVQIAILQPTTNAAVTSLWRVNPGQTGFSWLLSTGDAQRGIAYDTNTHDVVVSAASGVYVVNGDTGAFITNLSLTGATFGGFFSGPDQVGVADDGAVYVGNAENTASYVLYRWSSPTNTLSGAAYLAFPSGDPGNGSNERWGDSMAVRGAGIGTQILLSSSSKSGGGTGTNVAYFTTVDGSNFTAATIAISGVPGGFGANGGLAFGAGNTFWAKSSGGDLYEISYDTNTLTGSVVLDYHTGSQIASSLIGVGIDPVNNIFASISPSDKANDMQLFQLTGTSDAPVLFNQTFFGSANVNGNQNAAIAMKYPRAYGLDVNNGIVGVTYGVPSTTPVSIGTQPSSITSYTNAASVTFSVGASGSLPLYYQWRFNSNNISGATGSTYTVSGLSLNKAGYYDVVVRNIASTNTSTEALLTLIVPVTSTNVTPLWAIGPGTNGTYLTTSGYETRGLAYDTNTANVFLADHFKIHVYAGSSGLYLGDLNTTGLPNGGVNGWVLDQLGVADDGILYSCNLTTDGTAFSILSFTGSGTSYGAAYAYGGSTGGSDLSTLSPGDRWGDTMAIRGSGTGTQILFGSDNGTNVALFTTADGSTFTPQIIAVQGGVPLGFSGLGIAFGPGNTFYAKGGHNYNLRQVSFDTNTGTGTVIQTYLAGTQVPNDLTGLGVDVSAGILGGVCYNDSPHDVRLYTLSGNTNAPGLFEQAFFPSTNPNAQEDAVVTLKGGLGYALDVNNGVIAFSYTAPAAPGVTITSVTYAPSSVVINWNNTFNGHNYQVQYKTLLTDLTWTNLGSPVLASGPTGTYTDTSSPATARYYRVVSE